MDDAHTSQAPASPGAHTVGPLAPVHGRRIELDYTGQRIAGRYHVLQPIGSGGMADVYRARDERLCCDVALKFLKPRLASEEWCARMFQEAYASAAIAHPHILRITDVGRIGPSIYLAMDLLTGASLETVLRREPGHRLPWRRAVELFLPVCAAFQAAHEAGFIHRDIKPDNLFLRRRGGEERLIVLDLGIVKHMPNDLQGPGLPATATGCVLGTPAYMSPEQASGLPLGPGTDIYSLAVTLYRVLSGRLPFVGIPGEPFVVLTKHIYEAPPPLFEPGAAPDGFPARLEALVLRALAKRPEDRPGSMAELAVALSGCLATSPPDSRPAEDEPFRADDVDARSSSLTRPVLRTPTRSERVPALGPVSVVAAIAGALFGWPPPPAEGAIPSALASEDRPAPACVPSDRVYPSAAPPRAAQTEVAARPEHTVAPAPERDRRQLRRSIAGMAGPIERCVLSEGDADAASLTIELTISPAGAVTAAGAVDPDASLVSPCVERAMKPLRLGLGPAQRLRHTFTLRHGEAP